MSSKIADELRFIADGPMLTKEAKEVLDAAARLLDDRFVSINREDWDRIADARFLTDDEKRRLLGIGKLLDELEPQA